MTKIKAEFLTQIANELNLEVRIYENYSGRGAFGRTTTGIVTDDPTFLLGAAANAVRNDYESEFDSEDFDKSNFSFDNMGLSMIMY